MTGNISRCQSLFCTSTETCRFWEQFWMRIQWWWSERDECVNLCQSWWLCSSKEISLVIRSPCGWNHTSWNCIPWTPFYTTGIEAVANADCVVLGKIRPKKLSPIVRQIQTLLVLPNKTCFTRTANQVKIFAGVEDRLFQVTTSHLLQLSWERSLLCSLSLVVRTSMFCTTSSSTRSI